MRKNQRIAMKGEKSETEAGKGWKKTDRRKNNEKEERGKR